MPWCHGGLIVNLCWTYGRQNRLGNDLGMSLGVSANEIQSKYGFKKLSQAGDKTMNLRETDFSTQNPRDAFFRLQ